MYDKEYRREYYQRNKERIAQYYKDHRPIIRGKQGQYWLKKREIKNPYGASPSQKIPLKWLIAL